MLTEPLGDLGRRSVAHRPPPGGTLLRCDSLPDYGCAVALAARRPDLAVVPAWLPVAGAAARAGGEVSVHRWLGGLDDGALGLWIRLQRLWHRWQAPRDRLPVMRWYLTAATDGADHDAVNEAVDTVLQRLRRAAPADRPRLVAEHLGLAAAGGALLAHGAAEWALPALLLAVRTGRPLVWCESAEELLATLPGVDGDLAVAGPPDGLGLADVARVAAAGGFEVPYGLYRGVPLPGRATGFLTARTPETLSAVVARQLLDARPVAEPVVAWVLPGLDQDPPVDTDTWLLNRERAAAGYLDAIGELDLVLLSGHSREDMVHLGPDALCGRSEIYPGPGGGRLPACVHDGSCVKQGEVLPVSRLRTPVLVLNGCNLMRIGGRGTFGPEFTLPFSFLEGSGIAAVASRRTRFGDDAEVLLADRLLRTGHSLGETVRVLNTSLPHWGKESPDYLLLGDPRLTPVAPAGGDPAVADVHAGDGLELTWRDVDACLLEARVPALPERPELRVVRATGAGAAELSLFAALAPQPGGGWRVLLFSWTRIRLAGLTVRLAAGARQAELRAELAAAGEALESYRRLLRGLLPGLDNAERELAGRATSLARAWAHARSRPDAWAGADRAGDEVTDVLDRLDAELAAALLHRVDRGAYVWLDQYAEVEATIRAVRHRAGPPCPYCGAPTTARDYRHLWRPGTARDFAICATCGNVWDTDAGLAPVVLEGPEEADRPGELRQVLVVDNPGDLPLRGHLGLRLYQGGPRGGAAEPEVAKICVPPRSQGRVDVTIRVGHRQPAHVEFLRGFLVSRLRVGVFQRTVWIRPAAASRLRPPEAAGTGPA